MKLLIAVLLTLILTACSAAPAAEQEKSLAPEPETEEIVLPEEVEAVIRYETEIVRYGDARQAEDGTPLLTWTAYVPVLTAFREDGTPISMEDRTLLPEEERALTVTEAFNEKFEEWISGTETSGLLQLVQEDLNWYREEGFDWYGGYVWDLSCGVYRTEQMLSISGLYYSYTGGAHPNTCQLGWNFDLEEGIFFKTELLADGTELQDAVTAEILRQVQTPLEDGSIPAEGYWEDYETLIADWSSYAVSFDEAGMMVVFSPYELAPYAAGPQEFTFSYDWLEPYLGSYGRVLLELDTSE